MDNKSPDARNQFFRELKPRCVSINDLTVRSTDKKASGKDLIKVTEDLCALLDRQVSQDDSVLDDKLADYVFFPLSNILRNQHEYPIRLTEVTIKCLRLLIDYGWKSKLPKELSQQLLILLTFIIAGVPGQKKKEAIPEETELESFKALASVVRAAASSPTGHAALVDANAIPALGHTITVTLEGITDGRTAVIQLEALQVLAALVTGIKDQTALATFLPGVVSSLSRLLTPPVALKVQKRVLVRGIGMLQDVLVKVLGDIKVMGILHQPAGADGDNTGKEGEQKMLSRSWLKATTAKVKLALANVLKLRSHTSEDVQAALERVCITLLDECHQSLSDGSSMLVETAMILANGDEGQQSIYETSLADLARLYPELSDAIKNTVYNWVTSLPRIVQSSEERVKQQAMQNLVKGQRFLTTLQIDSSILDDSLAVSLRDSATALVVGSKSGAIAEVSATALELSSSGLSNRLEEASFKPVLIARETERSTREAFVELITKCGSQAQRLKLTGDMLAYVRESEGPAQVTPFWIAFELVKSMLTQPSELDSFLDFSEAGDAADGSESALEELYTLSVSLLDSQAEAEEDLDWRMQALALEVTTFAASRMRESFRPELVDVLYPIATFLGSGVPQLREHAIISLNNIAESCGYQSVTDLIIDNVDYMVNSVSLRLNTFDISPASTQVLRMMIKLTGPRLVPFLDDVIASIFAALDNYHGYTLFVESLFGVLAEVVTQGTRSNNLLAENSQRVFSGHKKCAPKATTTDDLCGILESRAERQRKSHEEELEFVRLEKNPQRPFKASDATGAGDKGERDEDDNEEMTGAEVEKTPPPETQTFQILSRITSLTQHYLTSPTPTLRRSLLNLLATVCPALAPDEDAFLPLVNAVWPVLIERLHDPEAFVVVAACEALSALCASAGDFLHTRFKTEWWDHGLGKWCRKVKAEASRTREREKKNQGRSTTGLPTRAFGRLVRDGSGGGDVGGKRDILVPIRDMNGELGVGDSSTKEISRTVGGSSSSSIAAGSGGSSGLDRFSQAVQIWDAVQKFLVALVSHVRIDDDIFDELLPLLAESLEPTRRDDGSEARAAFEAVDVDAVWLFMYERGMIAVDETTWPRMEGARFVKV
ncbi:ARM repeat-containing protein [Xylariaceae sp. FL0594]|nr:ARM repeat-containing protein [Xylariaceae sp. FL0594]